MLQPSFHIEADNIEAENFKLCRLLIVINDDSLSYAVLNTEKISPVCIKYFHFSQIKNREHEEIIREIIYGDDVLVKEMNETFVVYSFSESTLVPESLFDESLGKEFAGLIYGNLEKGLVVTEKVPWWDMYNVYRIPLDVHKLMQYKFPSSKHLHYYSLLLKSYKKFSIQEVPESMQVIFFEEKMIVSVYKKSQLQLVQSFFYANQMDVAYHLLNCSRQLDLNQGELRLQISGFVEKKSLIYNEIGKYFLHLSFEEIGDSVQVTDKLEQYPLHYFSSLLKLAACV